MRVVSVLPSATEIVFALGHGSELVGRSAECDHPPEVRGRPIVMRPRTFDAERPSREIDARVRAARDRGESLYTLDVPLLQRLRPDLFLTQDLCGVCSVTESEVRDACALAGIAPAVVALTPRTLEEVWRSIATVAQALDDRRTGESVVAGLRARSAPRPGAGEAPRVAVLEWLDPPILAGLWASEMVARAGGRSVGPAPGVAGERTTWHELAQRGPELVILSPCSFTVERTQREIASPEIERALGELAPALGTFLADEAYFSRPGPRLADGIDLVARLLRGSTGASPMPAEPWVAARRAAA